MNPFKSKKGLGRGLSSLIGDNKSKSTTNKVLISDLIRNKYQPRMKFDKETQLWLRKTKKKPVKPRKTR